MDTGTATLFIARSSARAFSSALAITARGISGTIAAVGKVIGDIFAGGPRAEIQA
jgi:hypothetical protein